MTFRRGGAGKRRDSNEKAVIEALEAVGATIWQINGRRLPDLLVLYKGTWTPLAVKTEKGDLQPGEEHARWPLVRSEEQALKAIGVAVPVIPLGDNRMETWHFNKDGTVTKTVKPMAGARAQAGSR